MTDVAFSAPQYSAIELPTNDVPISFDGYFMDDLDNGGDRSRWAVLCLYRWLPQDADQPGYILYTIGHSVIYHVSNGECGKGEAHAVSEFPDLYAADRIEDPRDLDPCEKCQPDDWRYVPPGTQFEVEVTWYKWTACRNASELLLAGRKEARCRNCLCKPHRGKCSACSCDDYEEAPRPLSVPMQRLLAKPGIRADADITAALREKKIRL